MPKLTPDELLITTRAVRKRLDLERPVKLKLIRECIEIGLQAPTGGNSQSWQFVVVTDTAPREALADFYRRSWKDYRANPASVYADFEREPAGPRKDQLGRVIESADFLVANLHRVPVHVIPCMRGRSDRLQAPTQTSSTPAVTARSCPRPGAICWPRAPAASVQSGRPHTFYTKKTWPKC